MSTKCTIGSVCIKDELKDDKTWDCACKECTKDDE